MKIPDPAGAVVVPGPEPTDPEWIRIKEMEARTIAVPNEPKYHKLVNAALRSLSGAKPDERGILQPRSGSNILNIRVSKTSLDRALRFLNAVIETLEVEVFPVTVTGERHGTVARVFGHAVHFEVVEKLTEKGRCEVNEYSWTKTLIDYEPSGRLEFRVGSAGWGPSRTLRDGKKQRLEDVVCLAVGAIMREGRELVIRDKQRKQEEIVRQQRAKDRAIVAEQIREEEHKLKQLEGWVDAWWRTKQIREFVSEVEKVWTAEGHDLSPEAPKGQRIAWMKQQADRLDPFISSKPASVLDRKAELSGW